MTLADDLTAAQYRTQSAIADATTRAAERLFADLFDVKDVASSWRRLEPLLTALVQSRHQVSAGVAANYVSAFRSAMAVPGRFVPAVEGLRAADDIVPWLRAAGPSTAYDLIDAGRTDVAEATLKKLTGSVSRMTLDGGRDTTILNVDRDPQCIGWARTARGGCCAFCAMLASRGAVYKSRDSAKSKGFIGPDDPPEQYHHNCKCQATPIYSDDQTLPPNSDKFRDLWSESTRGIPADEKFNAFRRVYEGRDVLV